MSFECQILERNHFQRQFYHSCYPNQQMRMVQVLFNQAENITFLLVAG